MKNNICIKYKYDIIKIINLKSKIFRKKIVIKKNGLF